MRKLLSVLLTIAMLLAMSITVFAERSDTLGKDSSKEIDVTAKYQSSTTTPEVYSVDIKWDNMTFTYTETGTKSWNANNHTYEVSNTQGAWDKTSANITVTNHSNVSVDVTVTHTITEGLGISAALVQVGGSTATLDAGIEGNRDGADSLTATLIIIGTPNDKITSDGVKIGTVKVTIE